MHVRLRSRRPWREGRAQQLQTDVPAAGFKLTEGEVEERDAESTGLATATQAGGPSARSPVA
jgi:hypothetical protein